LFPIGAVMRANLFVYRDMHDPWLRELRHHGDEALFVLLPRLRRLIGAVEVCDVKIRPVDLYVSKGYRQAGVVLVGDAFATSCPAAGTGCNKVFTDVERLCNIHIPRWLATPGMGEDKINSFYDDSVKVACEQFCTDILHGQGVLSAFIVDRDCVGLARPARGEVRRSSRQRRAAPALRTALNQVS